VIVEIGRQSHRIVGAEPRDLTGLTLHIGCVAVILNRFVEQARRTLRKGRLKPAQDRCIKLREAQPLGQWPLYAVIPDVGTGALELLGGARGGDEAVSMR
jgi:hypothetical protein